MDTRILTFEGETEPRLYACGACSLVYSPREFIIRGDAAHDAARKMADDCCRPKYCACGAALEKGYAICKACVERNVLRKATIIDANTYTGPIWAKGHGEWGDGYSSSLEAMHLSFVEYDDPVPAYCHATRQQRLALDAESIVEHAIEDMHEDADSQIVDADEVYDFIAKWNAKQTCVTYDIDRSRVIILDQERFDAILTGKGGSAEGDAADKIATSGQDPRPLKAQS